jgi:carbamoyltransferase
VKVLSLRAAHHASACIINDGVVQNYFKEERYSGVKHDWRLNNLPQIIIDDGHLDDVDYFFFDTFNSDDPEEVVFNRYNLFKSLNPNIKFIRPKRNQHHLYHASVAFYNSGFEKSLIFVIDSSGAYLNDETFECDSVYVAEYPHKFTPVYKHYWTTYTVPNNRQIKYDNGCESVLTNIFRSGYINIGNLYNSAAIAIGESVENCGKAMGLASYGNPIENFNLLGIGAKDNINEYFKDSKEYSDILEFDNSTKYDLTITKDNYQHYADYCYEIQSQCMNAVIDLVDKFVKQTGITKVCLSGGFAMNIVTNYELTQRFPHVNFFFEPMCDDSGLSIGSAMFYYRKISQDKKIRPIKTTSHHGYYHDVRAYKGVTAGFSEVAELLYKDKSVAVYYGKAESGARALGNRSILFNALNPNAKDIVNQIKKREWYRPFAAIVLEEDAHLYFDGVVKNEYMTVSFPVKTDLIPGLAHVDNTCRVQTVTSGHFYDILTEFKKLTGHGILLNTSFNLAGEVLVETPEQAFSTLNRSSLDYLWFCETKQLFKSSF